MTTPHSARDLVASILHAHASILHAPAPPLTSAELDEARSIVSQLLDGAGPPKPGPLPPALRTPRPLPARASSVSSSPVPRTVLPASCRARRAAARHSGARCAILAVERLVVAGAAHWRAAAVPAQQHRRDLDARRFRHGRRDLDARGRREPGDAAAAAAARAPRPQRGGGRRAAAERRGDARARVGAAARGGGPRAVGRARRPARRVGARRRDRRHRGARPDDACGGGRTLEVATAASLEAWEERLRAARLPLHLHQPKAARRTAQPVAPPLPAASSSPRTGCSSGKEV